MSVENSESIYGLIPPQITLAEAKRRHRSRFNDMVKEETKHAKSLKKTMGPAKIPLSKPDDFLKKHSKEIKLPEKSPPKLGLSESTKPRVPTVRDKPQMAQKTNKDFIKTNAISNITAVPKRPQPKYVDSPKGSSFPLEESGLLPQYVRKKTYGKVPNYLETRKKEMTEAQLDYERLD
jgi:hypothetical protein